MSHQLDPEIRQMEGGECSANRDGSGLCHSAAAVQITQKIYGSITFPGICVSWGLIVMVMVYSVGHISGAHFNPAVTITMAIFRHFPAGLATQLIGAVLASGTLCLLFDVEKEAYFGTVPVGSNVQSLVLEIIISFLLMFVISGVATDNRAVSNIITYSFSS
ncbi:Major intrinsic protein [Dillenia turbinata]|uniref:Major intrinsic protein n=1 Tax=Dillenia turbinata TaxID=194707 RepID=A0AAN8V6D1_9MAGN